VIGTVIFAYRPPAPRGPAHVTKDAAELRRQVIREVRQRLGAVVGDKEEVFPAGSRRSPSGRGPARPPITSPADKREISGEAENGLLVHLEADPMTERVGRSRSASVMPRRLRAPGVGWPAALEDLARPRRRATFRRHARARRRPTARSSASWQRRRHSATLGRDLRRSRTSGSCRRNTPIPPSRGQRSDHDRLNRARIRPSPMWWPIAALRAMGDREPRRRSRPWSRKAAPIADFDEARTSNGRPSTSSEAEDIRGGSGGAGHAQPSCPPRPRP